MRCKKVQEKGGQDRASLANESALSLVRGIQRLLVLSNPAASAGELAMS